MNRVVPWGPLVDLITPVYPKGEGAGRPPVGLERMLRIHCLQHCFNLSDPAAEEPLYARGSGCKVRSISALPHRCEHRTSTLEHEKP